MPWFCSSSELIGVIEALGGLILIGIGTKILLEHLYITALAMNYNELL